MTFASLSHVLRGAGAFQVLNALTLALRYLHLEGAIKKYELMDGARCARPV